MFIMCFCVFFVTRLLYEGLLFIHKVIMYGLTQKTLVGRKY